VLMFELHEIKRRLKPILLEGDKCVVSENGQ